MSVEGIVFPIGGDSRWLSNTDGGTRGTLPGRRVRNGMTLAEVVVVMFVMSLLLTAVYAVFIISMRYMRIAQLSLELQQDAMKAVAYIANDLADTHYTTVLTGSGANGFVFASPRDASDQITAGATGPLWKRWVGYYIDSNHNLVRKTINIAVPFTTPPTTTNYYATVNAFINAPASTIEQVATYDTSLVVTGNTVVTVDLTFTTSVQNTGDCQVNITDSISPRN